METTNTLKFASRAKFIPGKAKKAELFGGDIMLLVESLRAEVGLLRIQLADSHALVAKLKGSSEPDGPLTINGILANGSSTDNNDIGLQAKVRTLEQEKLERDDYINNLQSQVMRLQQTAPTTSTTLDTSIQTALRRSPPGNFSYPSNHGLRNSDPLSPQATRFVHKEKEETSDEMNALADKQLATNVLTQSQRSREEARTLQLQITLLKKREADKLGKENAMNGGLDIRDSIGIGGVPVPRSDGFI